MVLSKTYKIAGVTLLGLMAIIVLIIGDRGIFDIITALVSIFLAWLGWKRSLLTGLIAAALGFVLGVFFLIAYTYTNETTMLELAMVAKLIFICLPLVGSGLLLIESDWAARKAAK